VARLFISQNRLDAWSTENRVSIDGDRMTLVDDGRSFRIVPAVHFVRVAGGDPDPSDLVGKVSYERDLDGMGAELYMNSVIYRDTAYDVECGFMGEPLPAESAG